MSRTWARYSDGTWTEISTAPDGNNDAVNIVTLEQVLLLNLSESPFFANFGLPARQAVQQQLPPDFYVQRTQQYFSQFFASLIVASVSEILPGTNVPTPMYRINLTTVNGQPFSAAVPQ